MLKRYSLRRLFLVTGVIALGLTLVLQWRQSAEQQRLVVADLRSRGAHLRYSHETDAGQFDLPAALELLKDKLGVDYVDHPVSISFWESGTPVPAYDLVPLISRLRGIRSINCFDGPSMKEAIRFLPTLPELQHLALRRCMVNSDADIRPLGALNHLSHLTLIAEAGFSSTTPFSDAGVAQLNFATWHQLRHLAISSPNMTNHSLTEFQKIPHLRTLEIYSMSAITDDGIPLLADMRALTRLDLRGTSISEMGAQRLREALPHCHIVVRNYGD